MNDPLLWTLEVCASVWFFVLLYFISCIACCTLSVTQNYIWSSRVCTWAEIQLTLAWFRSDAFLLKLIWHNLDFNHCFSAANVKGFLKLVHSVISISAIEWTVSGCCVTVPHRVCCREGLCQTSSYLEKTNTFSGTTCCPFCLPIEV